MMELIIRIMAVALALASAAFIAQYSRLRWERSLEGVSTMLSSAGAGVLAAGLLVSPGSAGVLVLSAAGIYTIVGGARLLSLRRGEKRREEKRRAEVRAIMNSKSGSSDNPFYSEPKN